MFIRCCVFVVGLVTVEGCVGWTAPANRLDSLSSEEREVILGLPILIEGDLSGKEHAVLDGVTGSSCQYTRSDPRATKTDAMNEAKYWAKQQGADGIKNLNAILPEKGPS